MKKFIGTALVLCCLALPLAGCEDAISTVTSTTMSELEDIPNQILATPESAETEPEYNYIHFRYDNIWTVSALVNYEIVDNGQNIKFEINDAHCAVVLHRVRYPGKGQNHHSPGQRARRAVSDSQRQVPA